MRKVDWVELILIVAIFWVTIAPIYIGARNPVVYVVGMCIMAIYGVLKVIKGKSK